MRAFALVAALVALVLIGGCATTQYEPVERSMSCSSRDACDASWQRAQAWLATHAGYRLAVVSVVVLQTYGPQQYSTYPGFTVTRLSNPDGSGTIRVRAACDAQYGQGGRYCLFDAVPHAAALLTAMER